MHDEKSTGAARFGSLPFLEVPRTRRAACARGEARALAIVPRNGFTAAQNPRSTAASLKLLKYALQRLQFLTRLGELSGSGELLILGEVLSCLGNQSVAVARSRRRCACGVRRLCRGNRRD